jgi:hypothetical protein
MMPTMSIRSPCRPMPTGCATPSPRPTGAMPASSTPAPPHGPSLPGALFLRRDGRGASHGGCALCLAEPLRAGLAGRAQDWPWSIVRAHLASPSEDLTTIRLGLERAPDFAPLIETAPGDAAFRALRQAEATGRPVGSERFRSHSKHASTARCGRRGAGGKRRRER